MFKRFLPLLALLVLVDAYGEVRHIEYNGAHLIDTTANNYGIAAPSLLQNQWKTVSVNGANAVIISPTCQVMTKAVSAMSAHEQELIMTAKKQLYNVESSATVSPVNGQIKYGISRYSLDASNGRMSTSRNVNVNFNSYSYNGMSISKSDENNYSASKLGMPNNLARIFVNNDIATYVYLDGQVQMKPTACLTPAEIQLNQQIKQEAALAEQKFRQDMQNMQQNLHQNMQNMQQNLQQNMQNMQNNMRNIFGNGFPFNGMNNNMMNGNMMMNSNPFGAGAGNMMMNNANMMMNGNGMPNGNMMMNNGQSMMMNNNNNGMRFGNMMNGNGMFQQLGYPNQYSNGIQGSAGMMPFNAMMPSGMNMG